MKKTLLLVPILLTLLVCSLIILRQANAQDEYKTEKFLYVDFKTEILSPNINTSYTDLMPLNFSVDWRRNESWVVWIVPIFSYSLDNGSRIRVYNDQFIQGGPYIDWENNETEITVTNDTIDVSNLKDGIHTLTLYAEVSVAAGQLYGVNCTLSSTEFQVMNTSFSLTSFVEAITIPLLACLAIFLAVASIVILYKRKQHTRKSSFNRAGARAVSLFPLFFRKVKVFMMACPVSFSSEKHVSPWGRRLAWIRIHAWGACDPGFKSQRSHHANHTHPFTNYDELFQISNCIGAPHQRIHKQDMKTALLIWLFERVYQE
jgi:hypothetical protein